MKRILVGIAAVGLYACVAAAAHPWTAWGQDCTNWIEYDASTAWASAELCYDPNLGPGGAGWRDCETLDAVVWPGLDIELWVEMECLFTWNHTNVDIHRMSDYDPFYLYFHGTSACNNGQWVITTPPTALGTLEYLPFVADIFGRTGPTYGTDIPLEWDYRVDYGAWAPMDDGADGAKQFLVDLCDHSFDIRVRVGQVYHQEDGYYHLGGPGASICPANPM